MKRPKREHLIERFVMATPPVVYTHPFEMAVAAASFLIGLTLIIGGVGAASSGLALAPHFAVKVWQIMMLIGGPMALAGLLWRGSASFGMAVERAGLIFLATAWGTRAIVLGIMGLYDFQGGMLIALPLYLVVAVSCQIRATVIRRSLVIARRVATTGR